MPDDLELLAGVETRGGQAGVAVHKEQFVFTDVGQAIIDAVEDHPYWEMPIYLKRIYDKLKEQRNDRNQDD